MSTNTLYLGYHVSSAGGYMAMGKRAAALGVTLTVEDAAVERIADEGFDPLYGARPMRRVIRAEELGTHVMFLCDIVATDVDDSLLDAAGALDLSRAHLMTYTHGEYFALGKKIGKFGFSAAKKKKKPLPKKEQTQ